MPIVGSLYRLTIAASTTDAEGLQDGLANPAAPPAAGQGGEVWVAFAARRCLQCAEVNCDRRSMSVFCPLKDFPELASLSARQRMRVLRKARFTNFILHQKAFWVGLLVELVCVLTGDVIGIFLEYGYGAPEWVHFACAIIGLLIGVFLYSRFYYAVCIERFRPVLRNWLSTHPVPN